MFYLCASAWALEGFFQPEQVELLEEELELSNIRISQEILSNRQSSMLRSTVSLGHCTGAFISSNGLVLTNKHCLAQDANLIQKSSNPKEQNQEFPLQNTKIFVFDSYRDVSKDVFQKGKSEEDIQKRISQITRRCKNYCDIIPIDNNGYTLVEYDIYSDVRAVYIPPSSIGVYDGGASNWSWPQHSGDFALVRVYTDKKGRSKAYSDEHDPLQNEHYLTISESQIRENVVTLGYPNHTDRNNNLQCYISGYLQLQSKYELLSDLISIQFQSPFQSQKKIILEEIKSHKDKLETYPPLSTVDLQHVSSTDIDDLKKIEQVLYLTSLIYDNSKWLAMIRSYNNSNDSSSQENIEGSFWLLEHYDTYTTETPFIIFLLLYAIEQDLYTNSSISIDNIIQILNESTFSTQPTLEDWSRTLSSFHEINSLNDIHPIFRIHTILQALTNEILVQRDAILNTMLQAIPRKRGLMYQDAQGDLRISLGTVSGYEPRESVYFSHQTTTYGLLQKGTQLPDWFSEENMTSSPYYNADLQGIPINFISDADGARGSSGSPTLNEKGELIGVVFDKNQVPEIFDCMYENQIGRTIHVDIQYILWNLFHDSNYIYTELTSP